MNTLRNATEIAARYDRTLRYAHDRHLATDAPRPQPTSNWLPENVQVLATFYEWLCSGGLSDPVIVALYLPMAGHVLGLANKPHRQFDLDTDLAPALAYVRAKRVSAEWADMCRNALNKFALFLRQQRGIVQIPRPMPHLEHYQQSLPAWLVTELGRLQHLRQGQWRPARLDQATVRFWAAHTRLWRWLCEQYTLTTLADVKRSYLVAYVDHQVAAGYAVNSINADLRCFQALLVFLQANDYIVPRALFRLPLLKPPERLPRFLTDMQMTQLRDDLEQRVVQAATPYLRRDALLDRAAFYLFWHAGLRLGEAEELCLDDLDIPGRALTVRQGKGQKDRTVYLTATTIRALQDYLGVRGMSASRHLFLYRHLPMQKDLLRRRMTMAGLRCEFHVTPHRLRHTCATQLLNAGCRITSIQKLLGHRRLDTTLVYARVHDRTVADDYYAAMTHIETRLDPNGSAATTMPRWNPELATQLDTLLVRLAEPHLEAEMRLTLVAQVQAVLDKVSFLICRPDSTLEPFI